MGLLIGSNVFRLISKTFVDISRATIKYLGALSLCRSILNNSNAFSTLEVKRMIY
jgi:hypothetical protein